MVDQLLALRINELHNIDDGKDRLQKGASFNTEDDDDSAQLNDSQHISENESGATKSSSGLSRAQKQSLFSVSTPSIDSVNDADGLSPDASLAAKIKKKKHRRQTQQEEVQEPVAKSPPWYTRVELLKPVAYVALVILLYLMWMHRDVWIPRLLTSNSRIRHIAVANEEKLQEKGYTPPTSSSDNTNLTNSRQDDDVDDNDDDNAQTSSNKRSTPQKLNLRARRNKMSFTKERGEKKRHHHVRHSVVDDDDVDIDEVVETAESDHDEAAKKAKHSESPVVTHRHRHHRSRDPTRKKTSSRTKTSLGSTSSNSVVEQLRKLVSSRRANQKVLAVLAKETGLTKQKVKQLIEKKNFRAIPLDRLVSIVNSYDSKLLVVPK